MTQIVKVLTRLVEEIHLPGGKMSPTYKFEITFLIEPFFNTFCLIEPNC